MERLGEEAGKARSRAKGVMDQRGFPRRSGEN